MQAEIAQAGRISTDVCLLLTKVTEGPFFVDPNLIRADISERRPGLSTQLQVMTADCVPVVEVRVDVWHCDAQGSYSGVQTLAVVPMPWAKPFSAASKPLIIL